MTEERETQTAEVSTSNTGGIGYCWAGVAALVVGIFVLAIPMGILAIYLGSEGIKRGATVFGMIVKVGGWAEIVLTAIGILAMIAAGPR